MLVEGLTKEPLFIVINSDVGGSGGMVVFESGDHAALPLETAGAPVRKTGGLVMSFAPEEDLGPDWPPPGTARREASRLLSDSSGALSVEQQCLLAQVHPVVVQQGARLRHEYAPNHRGTGGCLGREPEASVAVEDGGVLA